ncbi:MAG: DUF302 domain-containing protein [Chloroflexota bacterium]|nr:MAG: DUF302 domain-containing protein [Chloroflexota bacterium]
MLALSPFTFGTRVPGPLAAARTLVESALRAEGFGVITEIDVQATLEAKLGIERSPFVILGACNPALAHRALDADESIGALLPCNVVLREAGDDTIIEAMDPMAVLGLVDDPAIRPVAIEARQRLERVIAGLVPRT